MKYILILGVFDLIFSPVLISLLRRLRFYKTKKVSPVVKKQRNKMYYDHLLASMDTPSSFGILFVFNLFFFLLSPDLLGFVVVLTSILLGFLGFFDDVYQFFLYDKVGIWGIRARYKIILQFLLFFMGFYLLGNSLLLSSIYAFAGTFLLNSFNITDGLDGLAAGVGLPTFVVFTLLEYSLYGETEFFKILLFSSLFLMVFLIFNIKPAKVWLGDSGSYAIGAILVFAVLKYDLIWTIPLVSVFLLEGLSSFIQIFSIKLRGKKILKIAPLHLHLLNSGWSQWKIILTFWVLQILIVWIVLLTKMYVG